MESPKNKWHGDFTVSRLRANLACKNLLHPSLEPEYAEIYKMDRSEPTIVRKDSADYFASLRNISPAGMSQTWGESMSRTGSLTKLGSTGISMNAFDTTSRSLPGTMTKMQTTNTSWHSSTSDFFKGSLHRTSSVPCLGSKRLDRISSGTLLPPAHLSSTMSNLDPKLAEKEKQADAMCRRLWTVANGGEYLPQEQLMLLKTEDPNPSNAVILQRLAQTPVPGIDKVLKQGAFLEWKNPDWDGATLLMKFVRTGSLIMSMYLIAKKADPRVVDNAGRGLLHWCAIEGHANIFKYLVDNISDLAVDAADDGGDTPLHLAAYHGNLPIVRILTIKNIDLEAPNGLGHTAFQLAEARRMWHVTTYLFEQQNQELDKAQGEALALRSLVRPCDFSRAELVKATLASKPKPKAKGKGKDGKKK